jgi:hypothetical protein
MGRSPSTLILDDATPTARLKPGPVVLRVLNRSGRAEVFALPTCPVLHFGSRYLNLTRL